MGRSLDVELNTNAPHDTTMNISCSENYELASSLPIRCNNGTWTEEPKCEPARCKILPSPPLNGMVVVSYIILGNILKILYKRPVRNTENISIEKRLCFMYQKFIYLHLTLAMKIVYIIS